jgi:DNA-binding NarL/FixJ family response regulator
MISTTTQRVYLLSPHPFVIEELSGWLAPSGIPFERVRLPWSYTPDAGLIQAGPGSVCVVDGCYPGVTTRSLIKALLDTSPETRVIVVAEELAEPFAFPLLQAGVRGLLTYVGARRQLLPALAAVSKGGYWVPRVLLTRFLDVFLAPSAAPLPWRPTSLSRREQDVLDALLQNLSNKEIASHLNIAERTVKFHVSNLLAKFHVQRRADVILHSFQSGALPAPVPAGMRIGSREEAD